MSYGFYNYSDQQQFMVDHARAPRVVAINETDLERSLQKIAGWLLQHYPGLKVIQAAVVNQSNRIYVRANFHTANGERKIVLFEVTAAVQNNLSTSMRVFPAGTVVRLWPGAGSAPPRIQVVGK